MDRIRGIVDRLAVDVQLLLDDLDAVAGEAYTTLHHVDAGVLLGAENDDVTAVHRAER